MAIELSGQLSEDVLGNLLQYLSLNLASGCLQVRRTPTQGSEVYFEQGKVVHVVTGQKKAVPALALLMTWNTGSFQFRAGVAAPERTINLPLDSLLLEAAYNADMAALSSEHTLEALDENTLLVAGSVPEGANLALSLRGVLLMRLLDGKSTLLELAERMGLSHGELSQAASELMNQNLAHVAQSPMVPPEFLREMTQLVIDIMGPMGEIVVDDAVYDLGLESAALPESSLGELLGEIKAQFKRDDWRREFEIQVRRVQDRYRLRG